MTDSAPAAELPAPRRPWWPLVAKCLLIGLVVWGVQQTVRQAIEEFDTQTWQLAPNWLVLAAGLYLCGLLPAAWYWHRILRALDQPVVWWRAVAAYYIGHLGKYVPGKALVIVIRVALIKGPRVSALAATLAVLLETLTLMSVGALWGTLVLCVAGLGKTSWALVAGAAALAAGVPTLPPVFRLLLRSMPPRNSSAGAQLSALLERIRFSTIGQGWLAASLSWFLFAGSLWAVLMSIGCDDLYLLRDAPLLLTAVTLSVVAGFLSLIPGGLIVRDAILVEILAHWLAPSQALMAAVLLRLVWLMSEIVVSVILYLAVQNRLAGVDS